MTSLTQAQIAAELDISQSTVSLVLADPTTKRVSAKTRSRIFDYINQVDPSFQPKRRNIGDICYLTPSTFSANDEIYTRLLDGVEAEAREQGINLIFKRWQSETDFAGMFADSKTAGIIHCGGTSEEAILQLQRFAPTVLLNHTFERLICNMVTIDNHGAIRQAVRHCYEMGHRRIGFVNVELPNVQGHFLDRLGGYFEAIYHFGLPVRPELVDAVNNEEHQTWEVDDVVQRFLTLKDRPTAVVCVNDLIAIGMMRAAVSAGLKVPEDLSVTGFDNNEIGRQWRPSLTTIHQKREDMGRAAVALLTRKIKEGRVDIPEKVLCEAELIVRESVIRRSV